MKHHSNKHFTFFTIIFFSLLFSFTYLLPSQTSAKEKAPTLFCQSQTLTIGKSMLCSVKNLPEDSFALFFSSNPKTASIEQKTGKILAKKKGRVTISAQIYKQNKKRKVLKLKLIIQPKDYIENADFSLKRTINPYDYTIMLKSSRIILKKEIKTSKLSITPEGKKAPKLSAEFSELSDNGKEIVYLLNDASRKKLCPHDNSMNGNYIIQSDSFEKKLKAHYEERLDTEDISGFVLDIDGSPISNSLISYQTSEGSASAFTDETGHYEVKEKGTPVSLSVEKDGYHRENLTSLFLSKKGTVCENFILTPETQKNLTLDFFIKDDTGSPVPDAQILLVPKNERTETIVSETTGENGTLLFTTQKDTEPVPYTKITSSDQTSFSLLSAHTPSADKTCFLPETLIHDMDYTLYITKNSKTTLSSYEPYALSFSPSDFYTNHLYFEITLKKNKPLNASNLMIDLESPEFTDQISVLSFSFFEAGEKKAIYEFRSTPMSRFQTSEFPISFSDGIYYLKISAFDKNGNLLCFSPIQKIEVKESQISQVHFHLLKKSYSRLLAYFSNENFPKNTEKKVSFEVYQKTDGNYFYLDTVSSSNFKQTISDLYTADFSLSFLLPSQTYLFLPEQKNFRPSSFLNIEMSKEHVYPTESFALLSPPFSKCACIYSDTKEISVPEDFLSSTFTLPIQTGLEISKEQIRTESSYLNSVVALYKKDGTFISTSLSQKLDKNTVFSKKADMIIDIYTNHEILLTNQSSYR